MVASKPERLIIVNREAQVSHLGTVFLIVDPASEDETNSDLITNAERMNSSGMTLVVCSPVIEEIKINIESTEKDKEKLIGVISGNDLPEEVKLLFNELGIPVHIFKANNPTTK